MTASQRIDEENVSATVAPTSPETRVFDNFHIDVLPDRIGDEDDRVQPLGVVSVADVVLACSRMAA
jgi:hypothetical protein